MRKILVVDDLLFARMNICDMLKEAGYETLQARDGREGMEKVLSEKPDCILSDLLMPEMDGIDFLMTLRSMGNVTPVIVLTADIQDTKRKRCLELGTAGFISKPHGKSKSWSWSGRY
jgi:twitching motility two-component system response regulator PilH